MHIITSTSTCLAGTEDQFRDVRCLSLKRCANLVVEKSLLLQQH